MTQMTMARRVQQPAASRLDRMACAAAPDRTSRAVGLQLQPGTGQSEFLTVYGGLELALGLIFLWPLWRSEDLVLTLAACLVVHGCLALFRTASILRYSELGPLTFQLAAIEWIIFIGSAILLLALQRTAPPA